MPSKRSCAGTISITSWQKVCSTGFERVERPFLTRTFFEPPNAPVVVAGEHKGGRVVATGSYRLFSNYGAGLSLRNNRTFAMNVFRWLSRSDTGKAPSPAVAVKKEDKLVEKGKKPKKAKKPQAKRKSTSKTKGGT